MNKSMHTIVLKLYKPSARKKKIMDEAMLNYSRAFQYLLDKAQSNLELIRLNYVDYNGIYRAKRLVAWIDKNLSNELNRFFIEPFKDSIKIDFAAALSGYLNMQTAGMQPNYPSSYISDEYIHEEYEKLIGLCEENAEYDKKMEYRINKLSDKAQKFRAIYFCRYSKNRNYSLLYNPQSNRYYVKLYLMNSKNENRKELNSSDNKLIYIDKKREVFTAGKNEKSFLILPLSFGIWQEASLKKAFENPDILKTARLVKRNGEYYLSVNILCDPVPEVETSSYMGVSRGIYNILNYSIVDKSGNILSEGHAEIDDKIIRNDTLYKLANYIVGIAKKNKSRILMERFLRGGDRITQDNRKDIKPIIDLGEYSRLYRIVSYRAVQYGLPPPVRVSSMGIFNTCPRCGANSKDNRFSLDMMICTHCGMTMEIERLGSFNVARKLIKYDNDRIKIKVQDTSEGIKFINEALELEFFPKDPFDCADEFTGKIKEIIDAFYDNMAEEVKKPDFKKKSSIIKKLKRHEDIFEVITIE